MELIPFSILYWISYILSVNGHTVLSACPLFICGLGLFLFYSRKYRHFLAPPAIFSMSWIFCIGLACLKLSDLQSVWSFKTWLIFFLIYLAFVLSFRFGEKLRFKDPFAGFFTFRIPDEHLFILLVVLSCVSVVSFIAEALILGFIPLFTTDTPHAYSYFHVSGLHYFTVLFVFVPSLGILYLNQSRNRKRSLPVICLSCLSLLLPVLLVSRFQLVFTVLLSFLTLFLLHVHDVKRFLKPSFLITSSVCLLSLIVMYILITVERAHSVEYLNGIFEMKNPDTPIFITQPYIYIVNNFENFDCLVNGLETHTNGLRMAYPLFALSGLKFLKPSLVSFPLYLTKEELTTLTMFYDAYYDFGMIGCTVLSLLLGFLYRLCFSRVSSGCNAIMTLICAQLILYLMLAFFTTWFSNPTTWFYLGVCIVALLLLWYTSDRNNRAVS